ncbi:hypothetical protein [Plantactinospora endophytica]|uniref:Uncharacterized protein n=1 Tax=Plantactinospora endophytica TaxID=673535 RepID=A0ABQ4E4A0_9ACTN|nr:hypothetical protein [Plantactinospora endophytica]GIG89526.1 hypothetical protein Pen02_44620 [Plantactinospora endophytica]
MIGNFTRRRRRLLPVALGVLLTVAALVAGTVAPAAAEPADRVSTQASVVRFNAIWEPGGDNRAWVHTWAAQDLLHHNGELFNQGWRIDSLTMVKGANGELRYNAIWKPGSGPSPVLIGWTEQQFFAQVGAYWSQGLRPWRINRYPHGGSFRYDAIFKPGTDGRRYVVDWTRDSLLAEDAKMRAQGYRLVQVTGVPQNPPLSADVRYVGIWMPGTDARPTLLGGTWDELAQANGNHWASGYRMKYLSSYLTNTGALRYDAIWEPGNDGRPIIFGWDAAGFAAKNSEVWAIGYRPTVLHSYLSPN